MGFQVRDVPSVHVVGKINSSKSFIIVGKTDNTWKKIELGRFGDSR